MRLEHALKETQCAASGKCTLTRPLTSLVETTSPHVVTLVKSPDIKVESHSVAYIFSHKSFHSFRIEMKQMDIGYSVSITLI